MLELYTNNDMDAPTRIIQYSLNKEQKMESISVVGVDLAKNVIQLHAVDAVGKVILKKAVRRSGFLAFFANLPCCLIGMEACSSSHYWARELTKLGHQVKLMAPQFVKPYVKSNKNDANDAEAICEAVTRPSMRFVAQKSQEQQALLLIHRERDGAVRDRTALINRIRATLAEFGVAVPVGPWRLNKWFAQEFSEQCAHLPETLQRHILRMKARLTLLESEITVYDQEIDSLSKINPLCQKLERVPGIGRLTASALVASIGSGKEFDSGRQLSAWLGLVPKQHSSGGKSKLLGISKRGDSYLRRLFIHGARAVYRHLNPKRKLTTWLNELSCRAHKNVVIVALANKLARIAWSLLAKDQEYVETI